MTIHKTVVILGAGAMGSSYASRFYDFDRAGISLAASGKRYHRLKIKGLVGNHRHYAIPVNHPMTLPLPQT